MPAAPPSAEAKVVHALPAESDSEGSAGLTPSRGEDLAGGVARFAMIMGGILALNMLGVEVQRLWLGDAPDALLPRGGSPLSIKVLIFASLGVAALAHYRRKPRIALTAGALLFVAQAAVFAWLQARSLASPMPVMLRPSWGAVIVLLYALLVGGPLLLHFGMLLFTAFATPVVVATLIVTGAIRGPHSPPQLARRMVVATGATWICCVVGAAVVIQRERERRRMRTLTRHLAAARSELQELGAYRLERRLGKGGMGEVWQATHRVLARPAAIKLVKPELLDRHTDSATQVERIMIRFQQEAKLTARLTSAHTVQVFDYGRTDDGQLFYVMELLQGTNLRRLVRQFGPQPAERVVPWLMQACDSLAEAHSFGLVHRDIKPDNLFLCRQGLHQEVVKVLDFGLAVVRESLMRAAREGEARNTELFVGSPFFVSPEQARGEADLDGRADLYSLGCVAWFLLTGKNVQGGESANAPTPAHPAHAPANLVAPPGVALNPALLAILQRLLAHDPEERPASADVLAVELRSLNLPAPDGWLLDQVDLSGTDDFSSQQTMVTTRRKTGAG